ncbi:efflux RND transporter periplasmic adaptor subunit [Consotaella aegiceratis]|uniref:efflux RND transporter periplasmic adaptor subunit n=1 Tax=Consotaella aegiceratis TaxID=3097961 RepID=UPI002F423308
MKSPILGAILATALVALIGCQEDEQPETAAAATPRPVLTAVANPNAAVIAGFSGTIEPRFETDLAFRTLGRIVSLDVDVGDQVEAGQQIAAVDADTLQADVRSARAQLASAQAQADTARASAARAQALFEEKTVSSADLESAEQNETAAEAGLKQAQADLDKAQNALTYAVLTAPVDGVITERDADMGEVVSAGETVMTLARTDVREAMVDIPNEALGTIVAGSRFRVRLQVDPSIEAQGGVREIAPEADALTRTNRVRILLDQPPAAFRLGSLIRATPVSGTFPTIEVPATAVVEADGAASIWVVDPQEGVVHRRDVRLGQRHDGQVEVTSGLTAGERVVTAGVHSLDEAQRVSVSGE